MKRNTIYTTISILIFITMSCKKDFLTKYPPDSLTDATFWKTQNDLQFYLNGLYQYLPGFPGNGDEPLGDITVPAGFNVIAAGQNTVPSDGGGWDWTELRAVNYFLDRYQKADVSQELKNHYAGEAKWFRAYFYFGMLENFGNVPWYGNEINNLDTSDLFKARDPRTLIADSILADINFAVANCLPFEQMPQRINHEVALALKARFCLYEGTFRKYHTELGLGNTANKWLQDAVNAADTLIEGGEFSLYSTGDPAHDYYNYFALRDAYSSKETILARQYSDALKIGHQEPHAYFDIGTGTGFSRAFVDSYLCIDGKPISQSSLYDGSTYFSSIKNRDPRLQQTIATPGFVWRDINGYPIVTEGEPVIGTAGMQSPTGYPFIKFYYNDDLNALNLNYMGENDWVIFRYAEVLLNYAEAEAELGEATQQTIDKSINKLRDRVAMPHMIIADLKRDEESIFEKAGIELPVLIEAIRRERSVELTLEHFRWNDLMRWKAGKVLMLPESIEGLKAATVPSIGSSVPVNNDGYIAPYKNSLPQGRVFNEDRDYYYPIPIKQLALNPNLKQNPGW